MLHSHRSDAFPRALILLELWKSIISRRSHLARALDPGKLSQGVGTLRSRQSSTSGTRGNRRIKSVFTSQVEASLTPPCFVSIQTWSQLIVRHLPVRDGADVHPDHLRSGGENETDPSPLPYRIYTRKYILANSNKLFIFPLFGTRKSPFVSPLINADIMYPGSSACGEMKGRKIPREKKKGKKAGHSDKIIYNSLNSRLHSLPS